MHRKQKYACVLAPYSAHNMYVHLRKHIYYIHIDKFRYMDRIQVTCNLFSILHHSKTFHWTSILLTYLVLD
jgi:hypothetical protein